MKYISEDLLSLHSIQSTIVKALNICVLNYGLWEFSLPREKLRAIMNKSKFKIKRMRRKEKSLVFKTKDTQVQIPASLLTSYVPMSNVPSLSLSQVHL